MRRYALVVVLGSLLACGSGSDGSGAESSATSDGTSAEEASSGGETEAESSTGGDAGSTGSTTGVETGTDAESSESTGEPEDPPPFLPLYRIEVRVHVGQSGLTDQELLDYYTEMNEIWWSQAGVCFEIHTVAHDDIMATGFDMWFSPNLGGVNGYYAGDHDVRVIDYPQLGPAPNPVQFPGARTAAHELGHGLQLAHDQASDDYLMRSGTHGWQLPQYQIDTARGRAEQKALADTEPLHCGPPQL